MKPKIQRVAARVFAVLVGLGLTALCVAFLQGQTYSSPENPIDVPLDLVRMSVAEAASLEVDEEVLDQENEITDAQSDLASDITEPVGYRPADLSGGSSSYSPPSDRTYFNHNLENKTLYAGVDPKKQTLEVEHLISELEVKSLTFYLNGEICTTFEGDTNGGVYELVDGTNSVYFTVVYRFPNGFDYPVKSKTYTVYYLEGNNQVFIGIDPDYGNEFVWNSPRYNFSVTTIPDDLDVLEITLNGNQLQGSGEGSRYYTAYLNEGINSLRLYGDTAGKEPYTRVITISYERSGDMWIETDLGKYQDQSPLYTQELTFYAYTVGYSGGWDPIVVKHNGTVVYPDTDGYYHVTLGLGLNTFILASDDKDHAACGPDTYTITSRRDPNATPPEGQEPKVYNNVKDGMVVNDPVFIFRISAIDRYGNPLYTNGVYVRLNGTPYSVTEAVGTEYMFRLMLMEGSNALQVIIRDADEYYFTYNYTIIYKSGGSISQPIGQVSVTVDANVVGLGTLASGTVDIYSGEPASYAVIRLLQANGYGVNITGSVGHNMYLKHVLGEGITGNVQVPEVLFDEIQSKMPGIWHGEIHSDSLGEGDFTNDSGWMVTVNGTVTSSGLSNTWLVKGDVVKVRYTLASGRDIGLTSNNFSNTY